MANFLSNLFNRNAKSVIGIDIGSSSIKIVQLSKKSGRAILETYGELALGPYTGKSAGEATNLSISKVVEAVGDMLREKEVNITTRTCGLAIPFSSSLMVVIDMPNMPKAQLQQMIPIEARKYVPVPISEVTLDWYIIPKDKNADPALEKNNENKRDNLEILIVALHNDTLNNYKEIVTKNVLDAKFFEIEIFSTMRAVLDQEIAPVMIVDMGATTTKLYVVEKGILRSSHMISRGSHNITDELSKSLGISLEDAEYLKREKGIEGEIDGIKIKEVVSITLNYIFSEANQVALAFEKKYHKNISKVMLVGGGSALRGVVDIAKSHFKTDVVAGDPFSKVVAPAFLEKVLKDTGPEFAVAVGLALRCLQEGN